MIARRTLDFRSYDDLLADVARLRDRGYDRAGAWDLPQMLMHLARTMDVVSDPASKPMPRPLQWAARRFALPWILRRRGMPAKAPMPKLLRPDASTPPSIEEATAALEAAIIRAPRAAGLDDRAPGDGHDVPRRLAPAPVDPRGAPPELPRAARLTLFDRSLVGRPLPPVFACRRRRALLPFRPRREFTSRRTTECGRVP